MSEPQYTQWELRMTLDRLPSRLDGAQTRQIVAWLIGRDPLPADFTLGAWS